MMAGTTRTRSGEGGTASREGGNRSCWFGGKAIVLIKTCNSMVQPTRRPFARTNVTPVARRSTKPYVARLFTRTTTGLVVLLS